MDKANRGSRPYRTICVADRTPVRNGLSEGHKVFGTGSLGWPPTLHDVVRALTGCGMPWLDGQAIKAAKHGYTLIGLRNTIVPGKSTIAVLLPVRFAQRSVQKESGCLLFRHRTQALSS